MGLLVGLAEGVAELGLLVGANEIVGDAVGFADGLRVVVKAPVQAVVGGP